MRSTGARGAGDGRRGARRALALASGRTAHGWSSTIAGRRRQAENGRRHPRRREQAVAVAADLAEPDGPAPRRGGRRRPRWAGHPVNSAPSFGRGNLEATTVARDAHLNTNLRAPFLLAQAFVRQLGERDGAHIINITDWRARRPGKAYLAYIVSKGLETLTRALAVTLGPRVQVNAIARAILRRSATTARTFGGWPRASRRGAPARPRRSSGRCCTSWTAGSSPARRSRSTAASTWCSARSRRRWREWIAF